MHLPFSQAGEKRQKNSARRASPVFRTRRTHPLKECRLIGCGRLFPQQIRGEVHLVRRDETEPQAAQHSFPAYGLEKREGGLVVQASPGHAVDVGESQADVLLLKRIEAG